MQQMKIMFPRNTIQTIITITEKKNYIFIPLVDFVEC